MINKFHAFIIKKTHFSVFSFKPQHQLFFINKSNFLSFLFFLTNFFSCVIIPSHGIKAVFALWQLNSFSAQNKCCQRTLDSVFRLRFRLVFWLFFRSNRCENFKQKEDKQMQYIEKDGGYKIAQEFFYGIK